MRLVLIKIGHPVLRSKGRPVPLKMIKTRGFGSFLKNMVLTMRHAGGVGLAANQVGRGLKIMVMECRENRRYPGRKAFPLQIFLNPRILQYSKARQAGWEGCLSIPGFRGKVTRSRRILFEARTPEGRLIRKTLRGFEARVLQHEVDHLNGLFYIDRMKNFKSWLHLEEFNRKFKYHVRDIK